MMTNFRNRYSIYYITETASTTAERNANKFIRCKIVCGKRTTLEAKVAELREAGHEIKCVRDGCGDVIEI